MAMVMAILMAATVTVMAEEEPVVGTWYLQSLVQGEQEIDASALGDMANITMTVNADGTVVMETNAETQNGTWTIEGNEGTMTFAEENTFDFTFAEDQIALAQEGGSMVFGKEASEAVSYELAPAVTDAKAEDFAGTWNGTTYVMYGYPLPLVLMGTQVSLKIEEDTVYVHAEVPSMEEESQEMVSKDYELRAELQEDGSLFVDFNGEDAFSAFYVGGSGISLTLREDGKITGVIPEAAEAMASYMDSLGTESLGAEAAGEEAEGTEPVEEGDSAGSSGDSASVEAGMEMYLLFEKDGSNE